MAETALPNVVALVGTSVATQLVEKAGSIQQLAAMLPDQIKKLGSQEAFEENSKNRMLHAGYLIHAEVLNIVFGSEEEGEDIHTEDRKRAVSQLAKKVKLAAATDVSGGHQDGAYGRQVANELADKFRKFGENKDKSDAPKALPVPLLPSEMKPKRGGEKIAKQRAKDSLTDGEKAMMRVKMGVDIEEQQEEMRHARIVLADAEAAKQKEKNSKNGTAASDAILGLKRDREGKVIEAATKSVYDDLLTITL